LVVVSHGSILVSKVWSLQLSQCDSVIDAEALQAKTTQLGFVNVIDAFHVVGSGEIPVKFFVDERATSTKGIRLTDEILQLAPEHGDQMLAEIEARWRLVETAWEMNLSSSLIEYDSDTGLLFPSSIRRRSLAKARDALNGYQKGACFYCYQSIEIGESQGSEAEVDHFFPHVLMKRGMSNNLDQIWNLVLACVSCNRGPGGKFDATPAKKYVERLQRRNEYLIESNLPIRETLMLQTGRTPVDRFNFLQENFTTATTRHPGLWETASLGDPSF